MKIDWNTLEEGFNDELNKLASSVPNASWWKKPWFKPAVKTVGYGGAAAGGIGMLDSLKNSAGGTLEGLAGLLPVGLAALSGLAGGKNDMGKHSLPYFPQYQKPSYLTPDPGTVSAISSPRAYASPIKTSSMVGSFEDAVQRRIANSVLNRVTNTDALGFAIDPSKKQQPAASPKELEIVAKYPELEDLLKDENNKAYLKKLLET